MAPQSVGTLIQGRNVCGDHLLDAPREMPFREMHGVRDRHDSAKQVGTEAQTLENRWEVRSSWILGHPRGVNRRGFAGRLGFFHPTDSRHEAFFLRAFTRQGIQEPYNE